MFNMDSVKLAGIPKVLIINGVWAVALIVGGILHGNAKSLDEVLIIWGIVTVVGLIGQALGLCKGLITNFIIWVVAIAVAWAFTFYALKIDSNFTLYAEVAPVWFALMGIGFAATAVQVDKLFWILAGLHFVAAIVMELVGRDILKIEFLQKNPGYIVAAIMGGGMLVAAIIGVVKAMNERTNPSVALT
jgi:hypothetical protein